ncbi:MAG: YqgE/AlgH family protein [Deltaproteobacteria bacterium]|nr:YqgE/AlgH family protein [Deltaproteobacteria bacterium]
MLSQALAPGLLLAAPPLGDPNFGRSVVLIAQHGELGALGWVVNGLEIVSVAQLLRDAGLTPSGTELPDTASYRGKARVGGPVSPRSAWLLFRREERFEHEGQMDLGEHWAATGARGLVEAIARGDGPDEFRLLLGYAGWAPGQLDQEISAGAWMPARLDEDLVFEGSTDRLWEDAYQQLVGVSPFAFTSMKPGSA